MKTLEKGQKFFVSFYSYKHDNRRKKLKDWKKKSRVDGIKRVELLETSQDGRLFRALVDLGISNKF